MSVPFIVEGVLLFVVGIIGLSGNTAAIIVFSNKRLLQRNFHALMLSLSVFDLTYVLVALLIFSLPQLFNSFNTSGTYHYILPWALPWAQIGLTGSIYLTMAITIERYFTVCHPFYHLSHGWSARCYIIPIICFAVIYNIPKFFELRTKVPLIHDPVEFNYTRFGLLTYKNATFDEEDLYEYSIEPTEMRLNHNYYMIYCMWLNFFLMGVGPFVVLITLNTMMLRKLKEMANERELELGGGVGSLAVGVVAGSRQKEVVLANVSLVIVFVFIICHSIKWIPNIYELLQFGNTNLTWPVWVETITNCSHLLMTFNSSVNFFIYCLKHSHTILRWRNQGLQEVSILHTVNTRIESNCVYSSVAGTSGHSPARVNQPGVVTTRLLPMSTHGQKKDLIVTSDTIASTQL